VTLGWISVVLLSKWAALMLGSLVNAWRIRARRDHAGKPPRDRTKALKVIVVVVLCYDVEAALLAGYAPKLKYLVVLYAATWIALGLRERSRRQRQLVPHT